MRVAESIAAAQYVTDPAGARTDVIVPLPAWESLLAVLEEMADRLDHQEDEALLHDWLRARAAGTAMMIPLAELEEEMRRDAQALQRIQGSNGFAGAVETRWCGDGEANPLLPGIRCSVATLRPVRSRPYARIWRRPGNIGDL